MGRFSVRLQIAKFPQKDLGLDHHKQRGSCHLNGFGLKTISGFDQSMKGTAALELNSWTMWSTDNDPGGNKTATGITQQVIAMNQATGARTNKVGLK